MHSLTHIGDTKWKAGPEGPAFRNNYCKELYFELEFEFELELELEFELELELEFESDFGT